MADQRVCSLFFSFKDFDKLCATFHKCQGSLLDVVKRTLEALKNRRFEEAKVLSKIILDFTWEKLHTGHWKDVMLVWREMYALGELISAIIDLIDNRMAAALERLDKGIMMGATILNDALRRLASTLTQILTDNTHSSNDKSCMASLHVEISAERIEMVTVSPQTSIEDKFSEVAAPSPHSRVDLPTSPRHLSENGNDVNIHRLKKPITFKNYKSVCQMEETEVDEKETGEVMDTSLEHDIHPVDDGEPSVVNTFKMKIFEKISKLSSPSDAIHLKSERHGMLPSNEKDNERLLDSSSDQQPMRGSPEHISSCHCPSIVEFHTLYMKEQKPVVLTGCINHWPAFSGDRKWSLSSLNRRFGPRTVPVELGSRYTDDDWSQKLMKLSDFIDGFVKDPQHNCGINPVGYLAQHPLFDQIPELQEDIAIPEYCSLSDAKQENQHVQINAWFGPKGTVSPLHFDPDHNLLVQVLGSKYIQLFPASQTPYLYPHEGLLSNTSQIDVENPDMKNFPLFAKVTSLQCTLLPGEMLYIPPKCWHYVRSLDVSFSVSFWWK